MNKQNIILTVFGICLGMGGLKAQSNTVYSPRPEASQELKDAAIKVNRRNDSISKLQAVPANNINKAQQTTEPAKKENKPQK